MQEVILNATLRTAVGKKARAMRRQGTVPGVYYVHGEAAIPVAAPELVVAQLRGGGGTRLIRLKTDDGQERACIVREIAYDPVTERPIHFDLQGVRADEKIRVEVPVVLKGPAAGQRDGGLVQHVLHRLRVECLPTDIPDHVEVDITPLLINHSIHVRDLQLGAVHVLENPNSAIVAVIPPVIEKAPVEEAAAAAAEPTEPEVIKKGKEEEAPEEEGKEAAA